MNIQIGDVVVTARWKTVEDAQADGFCRLTTMFEACQARHRVELELGGDYGYVKLRIKRYVGFYFVQARVRGRKCDCDDYGIAHSGCPIHGG